MKKCPTCGHVNSPGEAYCFACMADLSSVKAEKGDDHPIQGLQPKPRAPVAAPPPVPKPVVEEPPKTSIESADPAQTVRDADSENKIICRFEKTQFELENGSIMGRHMKGREFLENVGSVSRKHAQFTKTGGTWYVEDLGSTNGTYVNGELLAAQKKHPLKKGDSVSLSTRITFEIVTI